MYLNIHDGCGLSLNKISITIKKTLSITILGEITYIHTCIYTYVYNYIYIYNYNYLTAATEVCGRPLFLDFAGVCFSVDFSSTPLLLGLQTVNKKN